VFSGGCSRTNSGDVSQENTQTKQESGPISQPDSSAAKVLVLDEGKSEEELRSPWDLNGIKDFELIERSGKKVTKADLLGKPWVACFIFTNCVTHCLDISKRMNELQDWVKESDVLLVSISVDPKNDTPQRLRGYADNLAADEHRWLFLTGDKDVIYRLASEDFKTSVGEYSGEPFHTNNLYHIDEEGRIIGKYNAMSEEEMNALKRKLRNSSAEETEKEAAGKQPLKNGTSSSSEDR
ncbi:MAG: SCO family protein, partial [Planctomycetes bacterium]|nr:SCO family protein [Planctomycetota bacterium]